MLSYVIRLKDDPTSESLADECVASGKRFGLEIEKFNGIYGLENIKRVTQDYKIRPYSEGMKKGRVGVKGCFLSHYTLWNKSLELDSPILILEQDAEIISKIPKNIENMFDEFLLLDPFNKFSKGYASDIEQSLQKEQKIVEYFNSSSRRKYGVVSEYAMGLQAYIIKPKAVEKLKKSIFEKGYVPADMQCNKDLLKLQTVNKIIASVNKKFYGDTVAMSQASTTKRSWT